MSSGHFDNVREQIGCCGIWCGSCIVGNGALAELTRRYRRLIELHDLRSWGPKNFDYEQFAKGLTSIQAMAPCNGCLKGGGRDDCEIRSCARAKRLSDCTECGEFSERGDRLQCPNGKLLEHMRSGARGAGLLVRERRTDRASLIPVWIEQLHSRWPQSVLFDDQSDRW